MSTAKKPCPIAAEGITEIDYKDTAFLRKYLTKFNRIIPRYYSNVCLSNQKKLATAVKRARYMALLPYVLEVKRPAVISPTLQVTETTPVIDEAAVAL